MASFGDFYNKNKKKPSKDEMAKKAAKAVNSWVVPTPVVISRGKKNKLY